MQVLVCLAEHQGQTVTRDSLLETVWAGSIVTEHSLNRAISTRSGGTEIWTSDADGSNLLRLTSFNGPYATMPRWSPDGRRLVFDCRSEGNANIYQVDGQGGQPRLLTTELSEEVAPIYSRDGRWIYFASNRTGDWQVWKMPSGSGSAIQITQRGGFAASESADGKHLYFTKQEQPGLWRMPVPGGEEERVLQDLEPVDWANWVVGEKGIWYVKRSADHTPSIAFFDFAARAIKPLVELPKLLYKSGLSLSPDGTHILFTQVERSECDIVLVELFMLLTRAQKR
jgi:dipeptidyl aminopeptidase/acylaminoacyl peptidase